MVGVGNEQRSLRPNRAFLCGSNSIRPRLLYCGISPSEADHCLSWTRCKLPANRPISDRLDRLFSIEVITQAIFRNRQHRREASRIRILSPFAPRVAQHTERTSRRNLIQGNGADPTQHDTKDYTHLLYRSTARIRLTAAPP